MFPKTFDMVLIAERFEESHRDVEEGSLLDARRYVVLEVKRLPAGREKVSPSV